MAGAESFLVNARMPSTRGTHSPSANGTKLVLKPCHLEEAEADAPHAMLVKNIISQNQNSPIYFSHFNSVISSFKDISTSSTLLQISSWVLKYIHVCGTIISYHPSYLHVRVMDQSYHMDQSLGDYLHQNRSTVVSLNEPRFEPLNNTEATAESSSTGNTPSSTSVPSLATNFSSESEGSPFLACPAPKPFTPHPLSVIDQNWSYLDSSKRLETPVLLLEAPRETIVAASASATQVNQTTPIFNQEDMR
jgi:hypothetical protein